jgi:membrane protease YdiL (CAAX protease family)
MLALALLALVPVILWLTQTALLLAAGRPVRARISSAGLPGRFKRINRIVTYATLAAAVFAYPLSLGRSPLDYYGAYFPPEAAGMVLWGASGAVLYLALLYLAWLLSGNARFRVRHTRQRLAMRLAAVPLTAALAALVEELLFRGMLLADLLRGFPTGVALAFGAVLFAAAHYVRSVKRYWTFPGHLALGALFCVAFVCTRNLWLSTGLHAGGILMLMGVRPFVRYTGPAWLVGASIFPYAGAVGFTGLVLLTLNIWLRYGGGA